MILKEVYQQPQQLMNSRAYQDNPTHKSDQMLKTLAFHKHVLPGDERSYFFFFFFREAQVVKIS